jgi:thiamine biosynthesis lipoprotein
MMKKHLILVFLVCAFLTNCRSPERWQTSTLLFFDTVCELNLHCSASSLISAKEEVRRVFSDIETHFSPGAEDRSSALVISLFQRALDVYLASDGSFDITVGPLSKIWGFRDGSHRVPSFDEIQSILKNIGMDKLEIKKNRLFLEPGMELDWGGIAKGFGIDLASQALIRMQVKSGFINAGGDLYCWGTNPENKSWRVGIKHPRKGGYLGVLSVSEIGLATTGDYQRYFIKDGIRYHHVFNPKSGYPSKGKQSVTVIGPETSICDALSTALFVSPRPEDILQEFPKYGAILLNANGEITQLGRSFSFQPLD